MHTFSYSIANICSDEMVNLEALFRRRDCDIIMLPRYCDNNEILYAIEEVVITGRQ